MYALIKSMCLQLTRIHYSVKAAAALEVLSVHVFVFVYALAHERVFSFDVQ